MRPSGTVLSIAVALVWHPEVQRVRPQRRITERRRDGGVVEEGLLLHHKELIVASHTQVGRTHTNDRIVGDVGEALNDETHSGHFFGPRLGASFAPVLLVGVMASRVYISKG